jgi:AbrB family looped-hinge helix DNA binding protein
LSKVKITRNYQITIPKEIRDKLKLKLGEKVTIRLEGDKIIVQRISDTVWENCTDFLPENFDKILESLREDSKKRFKRLGIIE